MTPATKTSLGTICETLMTARIAIECLGTEAQTQFDDQTPEWKAGKEGEVEQNKIDLLRQSAKHLTEVIEGIDDAKS